MEKDERENKKKLFLSVNISRRIIRFLSVEKPFCAILSSLSAKFLIKFSTNFIKLSLPLATRAVELCLKTNVAFKENFQREIFPRDLWKRI